MRRKISSKISSFLLHKSPRALSSVHHNYHDLAARAPMVHQVQRQGLQNFYYNKVKKREISSEPTSLFTSISRRYLSSSSPQIIKTQDHDDIDEFEPIDLWEEEEEVEPKIGDGGDGGGVVLQNCPWGEKALSIAHEVLLQFGDDMKLFALKASPRGYIYVRLDKLSNEYGCPSMEELESFSKEYKAKLDEVGATGEIPDDLALDVITYLQCNWYPHPVLSGYSKYQTTWIGSKRCLCVSAMFKIWRQNAQKRMEFSC